MPTINTEIWSADNENFGVYRRQAEQTKNAQNANKISVWVGFEKYMLQWRTKVSVPPFQNKSAIVQLSVVVWPPKFASEFKTTFSNSYLIFIVEIWIVENEISSFLKIWWGRDTFVRDCTTNASYSSRPETNWLMTSRS